MYKREDLNEFQFDIVQQIDDYSRNVFYSDKIDDRFESLGSLNDADKKQLLAEQAYFCRLFAFSHDLLPFLEKLTEAQDTDEITGLLRIINKKVKQIKGDAFEGGVN